MDKNNNKRKKNLKIKIIVEYIIILLYLLFIFFIVPNLSESMLGDNTGIDGIGQALAIVVLFRIVKAVIAFIFFIIYPIRILVSYKNEIKSILPKFKKIMCIIAIIIPILLSLIIILEVPMANMMYILKYETGKNPYSVSQNNYKSAKDFQDDLTRRGLIFDQNSNILLDRLNEKYKNESAFSNQNMNLKKYYYEEASLMTLSKEYFSDSKDNKDIIKFNSGKKAPVYIYNAIFTLPSKNEKLQYAAIGRYDQQNYLQGKFYPYFEDYYIECKILYVDGDIYAIIGVSTSWDIKKYFDEHKSNAKSLFDYNQPYSMILSEKESITTYVNGKYYPDGAIENTGWTFEMKPNTNEKDWSTNYPVRKVDRLDINAINGIAQELQNGILKDSIEYHFYKK